MKKLILILVFGLLPAGCATSGKTPGPSCSDDICYLSNPTGRIKNVIYCKRKKPVFVKDITWVPSEVTKNHITQGHIVFELMSADGGAK
jgi:hypothetical protein